VDYPAELVKITPAVVELTNLYIQRQILTTKYYDDATHIALATVYDVDILASWNFRLILHARYLLMEIINTMAMIRQIRDEDSQWLKNQTVENIIAFYRDGAKRAEERAKQCRLELKLKQ